MNRLPCRSRLALTGLCLASLAAFGAEYDEADILPRVTALTFTDERVGLLVTHGLIGPIELPAFVVERANGRMRPVPAAEHTSLFGAQVEPLERRVPGMTSDGTPYTPVRCDAYDGTIRSELRVAGAPLRVALEGCVSVSEIEARRDRLWLGTYIDGGHGAYGARGVVVVSRETGEILGRIDTGDRPVSRVRYDAGGDLMWILTPDRIVVADGDMNVVSEHFFYYDFDPASGRPTVYVGDSASRTHPLAVFATFLPPTRHAEFHAGVQAVPDTAARSFSLYDFFMCCRFTPRTDGANESDELAMLVPYLQSAYEHDLPRWEYMGRARTRDATRQWRQIACRHTGSALADRLCATADWGTL